VQQKLALIIRLNSSDVGPVFQFVLQKRCSMVFATCWLKGWDPLRIWSVSTSGVNIVLSFKRKRNN